MRQTGSIGAPTPNFLSMNGNVNPTGPDAAAAITFKESRTVNNGRYQTGDEANITTQYTNADVTSMIGGDELGRGHDVPRGLLSADQNNGVDTSTIVQDQDLQRLIG